jgi:hypothetical protein
MNISLIVFFNELVRFSRLSNFDFFRMVTAQLDRLKGFRLKGRRIEQSMDSEHKPEELNSPFKPNSLTA